MRTHVYSVLCLWFTFLTPLYAQHAALKKAASAGRRPLGSSLIALEHRYWEAWKRKDTKTLAQLRADDFREVDQDGVMDKKQAEQIELDLEITEFKIENERVFLLQHDVALLTYEVRYAGSYKGMDISSPNSYVASIYQRRSGAWRIVYSQETATTTQSGRN